MKLAIQIGISVLIGVTAAVVTAWASVQYLSVR